MAANCGYVSDTAPKNTTTKRVSDHLMDLDLDLSGYMSEGGISVYARKMQARFKEGIEAVRESMNKPITTEFVDDR